MKLSDYLIDEGITQSEFCKRADVSMTAISRAISGDRLPGRAVMEKIFNSTAGKVTPNDFFELEGLGDVAREAVR